MASNSTMQREVIKWLQTLELSSALKNPRRDLMSGFIVAEILSRFDKNLSLHSFDTGSALARRLDNWNQIEKYLKTKQCKDITSEDVRRTLMGTQGAAQTIIEKLYTFITKKTLKTNLPAIERQHAQEEKKPAFMRPTVAELVRLQNNNTVQRLGNLTGETDENKFIESNATILQKQKEFQHQDRLAHHERYERPKIPMKNLIAMVKGKHDGISIPSAGPGVDSADGGDGSTTSPSPRTRQQRHRGHQSKQVSLRTHNADLVDAFQQRQQHERDEQFRHQFDVEEDINRAFSRVIARPLQASGHFTLALELGASSSVISKDEIDNLNPMDIAPSSPSFPRVDILSTVLANADQNNDENAADEDPDHSSSLFPSSVIDACFEQLLSHNVKHNAARLLQQRPDDVVHLILMIDLVMNTSNIDNVVRMLRVVEEIGFHVSRLDPTGRTFGIRDELIAGLCPRIGDFIINNEQRDHERVLTSAFCKMLVAFTNMRDSDSLKKLLELVPQHTSPISIRSRVEATVAATVFSLLTPAELRVPGVESIGAFHASSLIHRSSPKEVACGWEIFKCIAPISAASAAAAVHFASQVALSVASSSSSSSSSMMTMMTLGSTRERWEICLLALITIMKAAVAHYEYWTNNDDAVEEGMELLDLIEVTSVRLFEYCTSTTSSSSDSSSSSIENDQRRAVFCAVAPHLRADVNASVAVTFVQKFILELPESEREALMRLPHQQQQESLSFESLAQQKQQKQLQPTPALPSCTGKSECYTTSALPSLWNVPELLVIVRILYNSLSSLQVIEMLSAFLVNPHAASASAAAAAAAAALQQQQQQEQENNGDIPTAISNTQLQLQQQQQPLLSVQEKHRSAWEETLRYAKIDLVNAIRNPVDLRDVSDAHLPRCQSLAGQVLSVLFTSLNNPENNQYYNGNGNEQQDNNGDYQHHNYYGNDAYDDGDNGSNADADGESGGAGGSDTTTNHENSPGSETSSGARNRVPFGAVDWISAM